MTTHAEDTEAVKQVLLEEVRLSLGISEKGISYNVEDINRLKESTGAGSAFGGRGGLPGFSLPHGNTTNGKFSRWTPYSIVVEDGKPIFYNEKEAVGEIEFHVSHPVHREFLSRGEQVKDILSISPQGGLHVMYSDECALKDLGEDCLFCAFNVRAKEGDRKVLLKSPKQVSEAYDLARKAGVANHFRITGGFVPERRELEYYIDVAEAIHKKYDYFYGAAIIGAPADLSVLPKYKEVGFENISTNIEVWNKNLFAMMCPGKSKRNGGWQHWIDSLLLSVDIFGKGNVHSTIVGGLEPLDSTLEGIEFFASKGIVCHFSAFRPEKGTALEGYRGPEASFHWELLDRATDIYHRYGFTTKQMYSGPASGGHSAGVFRIKGGEFENGKLTTWKFPPID